MAPLAFGVLILGAVLQVGAPPTPIAGRPPEDIVCHPNGIYGYAEHDAVIVQEKESWFQLEVESPNLHECMRRCYGYRFCYSLTYDHTRDKPCIFYLHASDKCPGKNVVNINEIEYKQKPVSVACLKCGEPVNPKSDPQTWKKIDDKPAIEFSEDEQPESVPAHGEQAVISESKDDNVKELLAEQKPSTTTSGYLNSCVVTFQVFKDEDINAFKTTHVATVSNINECAYICYQNSCSGAIFVPANDKNSKPQCKVQMREKEKCNGRLQRHYSFTHDKAVVLSCFRCQPDKPITVSPDAEITRATSTPRPELVKGRLTTIAGKESAESAEGPAAPESSNTVEDVPKKVISPPAMAPSESHQQAGENAAEETETAKPADNSVEKPQTDKPEEKSDKPEEKPKTDKSQEKSSDKSGEKPEEKTDKSEEKPASDKSGEEKAKSESAKPAEGAPKETKPEPAQSIDKPVEEKPAASEQATTPAASGSDSTGKTISLGKVTSGPVDFGGCLITFQADYLSARPSEFKSEFELNLNVESPEICATRCYQDGCTGALYYSNNGSCVLGYGDKHHCNKRPLINFLDLKEAKNRESIWIHCTSCRSGKYGATGSVTGNMENNKVVMGEQLADGKAIVSKGPEADATTAKSPEEKSTEAPKADKPAEKEEEKKEKPAEGAEKKPVTEATEAPEAPEKSAEEKATTVIVEATTVKVADKSGKKPEEKATEAPKADKSAEEKKEKPAEGAEKKTETPEEKPAEATTAKAADKSAETKVDDKKPDTKATPPASDSSAKPSKPDDADSTQGCLITFQAGDLSDRPKEFTSEFELNLNTETPEICATRCFQDGCTGALYFPKNGTCVLGYGDKQYCDKSPILRFLKPTEKDTHKESIWIHCTVCRSQRHGETFEPVAEEKPQSKKP